MKNEFRIGDLAKRLGVEKFVIRFWEKEFNINPRRTEGGQRFYREKDFRTFNNIKNLLYEKKLTIAGAKKILSENEGALSEWNEKFSPAHSDNTIYKQCMLLHEKLLKLRKLL